MSAEQSTLTKARQINLDPKIYGAFAEIGAGQEVARFFFQAGKASQTIAKTMSAYDMIYSDEIYGREASGRYVCESRLLKMLEKEYSLLQRRLNDSRGDKTCFFSFANTVATGDQKKRFSHGWMGIRFQTKPQGPANEIVVHIRLLDKYRLQQQEVLGVVGVNLVDLAFHGLNQPKEAVDRLVDNIKPGQISIDFLRFTGPDTQKINNHLVNLELVKKNLAEACLFAPDESILSASDFFYEKPVLIERGRFKPVTDLHVQVLEKGMNHFKKAFPEQKEAPLGLFELTMNSLSQEGQINEADFLERVRALCKRGYPVLVSNFFLFYQLKHFLRQYTHQPMGLILSAKTLEKLFDESQYKDLEGGILEGLGKVFDPQTKILVSPFKNGQVLLNSQNYQPPSHLDHLYQHFQHRGQLLDLG